MLRPHKGPSETIGMAIGQQIVVLLRPHKGPSETAIEQPVDLQYHELRPHKGPSETVNLSWDVCHLGVLRPHKGPSETRGPKTPWQRSFQLRPHKGPSETTPEAGQVRFYAKLRPHKGPSETMAYSAVYALLPAVHTLSFPSTRNNRRAPGGRWIIPPGRVHRYADPARHIARATLSTRSASARGRSTIPYLIPGLRNGIRQISGAIQVRAAKL